MPRMPVRRNRLTSNALSMPQPDPLSMTETSLFGVRLHAGTMAAALTSILDAGRENAGGIVCVANVDMLTRAKSTPRLLGIMAKARFVVTDGMPLVWALRRLQGRADAERVRGPSLMLALCEGAAVEGMPVFFYGGMPDEINLLQRNLLTRFPGLKIAGALSPPMLPAEPPFDPSLAQQINASGAGLLFVGLGCPKQEYWMDAHQASLKPISLGVGLAFALVAGTKTQAPAWMSNNGLEWLYRLCQEPGRLWKRYLLGNSLFIWYAVRDLLRPGKH